jgi:hypothetical protein
MQIPLGIGAYSRPYGSLPEIKMENRFFEQNPVGAEKVALLSRPGSKLFLEVGAGPIRTMFWQPGVFNGDLFIVSGEELYRYNGVDAPQQIFGVVAGDGFPVMTAVAIPSWEAVFITDGITLQYYEGEGHSTGTLNTGLVNASADDVAEIDSVYYKFIAVDGDVNAGNPQGTVGDPWLVVLGSDKAESIRNLSDAINLTGVAGTTYSSAVEPHPTVRAFGLTDIIFKVRAITPGVVGNAITTTTATGSPFVLFWGAGTLGGGGGHDLKPSSVPDGVPIVDLGTLASFIICVQGESRVFFWIRPGEVDIDALDFSSAEAEPDYIVNVVVVGDQFWLLGQSSSETWYASGDGDQPFLRTQGRAFSQGVIPGTVARVQETIIVTGQDRVVYRLAGNPERISHHGIEEKIRLWQEGA